MESCAISTTNDNCLASNSIGRPHIRTAPRLQNCPPLKAMPLLLEGIKVDNRARASSADEIKMRKSQENFAVDISDGAGLSENIALKRKINV